MTTLWFVNVVGRKWGTPENMSPLVTWCGQDTPAMSVLQTMICIPRKVHVFMYILWCFLELGVCPHTEMNSFTSVQSNSLNGLLLWNVFLCEARGRNDGIKSII